jgi:hypothetical protein
MVICKINKISLVQYMFNILLVISLIFYFINLLKFLHIDVHLKNIKYTYIEYNKDASDNTWLKFQSMSL